MMVTIPDPKEAKLRSRIVSVDDSHAHVEIHRGDWQNSETPGYHTGVAEGSISAGGSALYNPDTGRSCCVGIIARLEGFPAERVLNGYGDLREALDNDRFERLGHDLRHEL